MRQFTIELDEAQVQALEFFGSIRGLTVEQAAEFAVLTAVDTSVYASTLPPTNLTDEESRAVIAAQDARIIEQIKKRPS